MNRWGVRTVLIASLATCLGAVSLWVRSYWTLDQLYGRALGRSFDANSFNGQCQVRVMTGYHDRAGALERDLPRDPMTYVARQRWPLRDTAYWEPDPRWFPRPEYRHCLADARNGPGRYLWVELVVVPYWLVLSVVALPLLALVPGAVRRRRRKRAGRCAQCGYDLRASPGKCPECGAEPPAAQPAAVPGR